jgi:hypothetical protein
MCGNISTSGVCGSAKTTSVTFFAFVVLVLSGVLPFGWVSMEGAGNYTCLVDTPLGSTPVLTRLLTVLPPSSVKLNYSGG